MNLCAAPSPSSSPSPSPSSSTASAREPGAQRGEGREACDPAACEAFALALQSRGQRQQQSGDDEAETPAEPAPVLPVPLLPLVHAPSYVAPSAVGAIDPASRTQAVIESSLRDLPIAPVHPLAAAEPVATWEATLGGPNAVPVEVRATRIDPATPTAPQALWGLTLSSSALGADVLARHAPRLTERLRKQAIDVDHVRVERRDPGNSNPD